MTVEELASIVEFDTRDTCAKLGRGIDLFSSLESYEVGDVMSAEDSSMILDYFEEDSGMTLVLDNGDIVQLISQVRDGAYEIISCIRNSSGQLVSSATVLQKIPSGRVTLLSDSLPTLSGNKTWKLSDITASLIDQYSSNEVVQRLSSLISQGEVSLSTIASSFSDLTGQLSGGAAEIYSAVLSLGQRINNKSVMSVIQSIYSGFDQSKVNETDSGSITWAKNDYVVESFCGTIILGVVTTAAQVLSTILLFSGGLVLKVAGAIILGASYLFRAIGEAAQYVASTEGIVDVSSGNMEYAEPLCQLRLNAQDDRIPAYIRRQVKELGAIKLVLPFANVYLWDPTPGGDDWYINCEIFANLNFSPGNVSSFYPLNEVAWTKTDWIHFVESGTEGVPHFCVWRWIKYDDSSEIPSQPSILANPSELATGYDSVIQLAGNDELFSLEDDVDESLRRNLMWNLARFYLLLKTLEVEEEENAMYYPIYWVSTTGAENLEFVAFNYSENMSYDSVENHFLETLGHFFYRELELSLPAIPSWANINKCVIPALNRILTRNRVSTFLHEFYGRALSGDSYLPGRLELLYEVVPMPMAEHRFFLTPPAYDKRALWWSVGIGVAITVAAVTLVAVINRSIKKKMNRKLLSRHIAFQNARAAYIDNPSDENFKAYWKATRKYNRLATLLGQSTLSPASGGPQALSHPTTEGRDELLSSLLTVPYGVKDIQRLIDGKAI
jgi:hypothetical protein